MNIQKFAVNENAEKDGVWVDVGEGLRLKIARFGNKNYQKYIQKAGKPYRHQLRHGVGDTAPIEDLLVKGASKHILLDWENMEEPGEDGELIPVPYSEQKAYEYMKKYKDFYEMVLETSREAELFRTEEAEEAKGN